MSRLPDVRKERHSVAKLDSPGDEPKDARFFFVAPSSLRGPLSYLTRTRNFLRCGIGIDDARLQKILKDAKYRVSISPPRKSTDSRCPR